MTRVTSIARAALLFSAVLLVACGEPALHETKEPPVSQVTTIINTTLKSIDGRAARVSLSGPDERTWVADMPSCLGRVGDHLRSGHYRFYLQQNDKLPPEQSETVPFGSEKLEFNDQRPQMVEVLSGEPGVQPDLLLVHQYASCNGNLVAVLALSADAKQLVQVRFQLGETFREQLQVSSMKLESPGVLVTSFYNNALGVRTESTWELQVPKLLFLETKTERSGK